MVVHGRIIKAPTDTYAIKGDSVEFHCEVENFEQSETLYWNINGKEIYSYEYGFEEYYGNRGKYSVEMNSGHFTLQIKDLTLKDGGNCTCEASFEKKSAQLLVFGK